MSTANRIARIPKRPIYALRIVIDGEPITVMYGREKETLENLAKAITSGKVELAYVVEGKQNKQ